MGAGATLIDPATGKVIFRGPKAGSGDGDFGFVPSLVTPTPTAPQQTLAQFIQEEQNRRGMTIDPKSSLYAQLQQQFASKQQEGTAGTAQSTREKWLANSGVDSRIKDIIRGTSKFTDYTQTERRQLQSQYNQATNAGVVPTATTVVQQAKFAKLTGKYDTNIIVKQADKAVGLTRIADQVIANPGNATNQLAALYTLVKQLDPDSAVRERELTLAQNTLSVIDRVGQKITQLKKGQVLPPKQAIEFANAIKELSVSWSYALRGVQSRFSSEGRVSGIEQMWGDYLGGIAPLESTVSQGFKQTSSGIRYRRAE